MEKRCLKARVRTFLEVVDNNFDKSYMDEVYEKGKEGWQGFNRV